MSACEEASGHQESLDKSYPQVSSSSEDQHYILLVEDDAVRRMRRWWCLLVVVNLLFVALAGHFEARRGDVKEIRVRLIGRETCGSGVAQADEWLSLTSGTIMSERLSMEE